MQDLYRVVQGIDVFDPKFNIVCVVQRRRSPLITSSNVLHDGNPPLQDPEQLTQKHLC